MKPVAQSRAQRQNLATIFLVAILLGLGINLIGVSIGSWLALAPALILALGLALLLVGAFLLRKTLFSTDPQVLRLRGALAFEEDRGSIRESEISGYRFNHQICQYLNAFLAENQAYKRTFWESRVGGSKASKIFNPSELNYHTIITSVVEFWVLEELALHLNSYFVENEIDRSTLVTVGRDHLDLKMLKNRVLDLFTKDVTEREAFVEYVAPDRSPGILVWGTGKGGAIYRRLAIELPPESRLSRNDQGFTLVSNDLFDLTFECHFDGLGTSIPPQLLKEPDRDASQQYLVTLTLRIAVHNQWFLSNIAISQYEWLDSFIERLTEAVSKERLVLRLDPHLREYLRQ